MFATIFFGLVLGALLEAIGIDCGTGLWWLIAITCAVLFQLAHHYSK